MVFNVIRGKLVEGDDDVGAQIFLGCNGCFWGQKNFGAVPIGAEKDAFFIDFQNRLYSYKGAGFGLEPLLTQSAVFRPHNRSEDIPGLFMVGASTHPGAGVPGVLMSAKALEKVIPHATTLR